MTVQRAQRGRVLGLNDPGEPGASRCRMRPDRMDPGKVGCPWHTLRPTLITPAKVGHHHLRVPWDQGLVFQRGVASRAEGATCPPLEHTHVGRANRRSPRIEDRSNKDDHQDPEPHAESPDASKFRKQQRGRMCVCHPRQHHCLWSVWHWQAGNVAGSQSARIDSRRRAYPLSSSGKGARSGSRIFPRQTGHHGALRKHGMGSGKGKPPEFGWPVEFKPGRILFEMGGPEIPNYRPSKRMRRPVQAAGQKAKFIAKPKWQRSWGESSRSRAHSRKRRSPLESPNLGPSLTSPKCVSQ